MAQPVERKLPKLDVASSSLVFRSKQKATSSRRGFVFGGDEGDRTPDLMNAIHALSQLSYIPNNCFSKKDEWRDYLKWARGSRKSEFQ